MNKYEEIANEIIDDVCEVVEKQHPELNLKTEYAKESDVEEPAVIVGVQYYDLESNIADKIKEFVMKKNKEKPKTAEEIKQEIRDAEIISRAREK